MTSALLVLAAILHALALGNSPSAPATWDRDGGTPEAGEIATRCWTADVLAPCGAVDAAAPGYGCVGTHDTISVWWRAAASTDDLPEALRGRADELARRWAAVVHESSLVEIACTSTPQGNARGWGLVPRATAWSCLAGHVTGPLVPGPLLDGSAPPVTTRWGVCCEAGCTCAGPGECVPAPRAEIAGRPTIWRRVCAAVPGAPRCGGP